MAEEEIEIEVLIEGPGGELVFKKVKVKKGNIKALLEATKNPVARHNIKKELEKKKIKVK